jgi:hypothetical protein
VSCREQNTYLKALAFGKAKELVHVDMATKMEEAGLAALFPVVCWPETRAVSSVWQGICVWLACMFLLQVAEVATKVEKWRKQGVPVHFVCVELRKWLPTHCAEHEVVALSEKDFPDVDRVKGKQFNRRFLDLAVWLMAWDRYAIGATLLKQMSFVDAQHHKAVVVEVWLLLPWRVASCLSCFAQIASTAKSKGLGPLLGVIYDDLVRKQWEDLSMKLGSKWSVSDFVKVPQEDALRRAEVMYKSVILANKVCGLCSVHLVHLVCCCFSFVIDRRRQPG